MIGNKLRASVLLVLSRYAADPEAAILRAVNDTRDNDTVAAVVGAAVGALHGESALRPEWKRDLLGRTIEDDDAALFRLLDGVEAMTTSAHGRCTQKHRLVEKTVL